MTPAGRARLAADEPGPAAPAPTWRRPRIKPTVELFPASDGDLYLLASEDRHLRIRRPSSAQRALLELLDGRPIEDIPRALRARGHQSAEDDVLVIVHQLAALGVLDDADDDRRHGLAPAERERLERQLRYFGDVAAEPAAALQARLRDCHVTVLGLGGLGSWAAYALACTGIGRMTLVDHDIIELSNLNRQILYAESDLGQPKAQAAARRLRAFHSDLAVHACPQRLAGQRDVEHAIADSDLVLDLVDQPIGIIGSWVNAACFKLGIPYLAAGQFPPLVRIGPLFQPGQTGCYECQLAAVRREHPLFDELSRWRRNHPSPAATFGPACGIIGSLLANEAVNLLTALCEPATRGRAIQLDLRTLALSFDAIAPESGCPVCSS